MPAPRYQARAGGRSSSKDPGRAQEGAVASSSMALALTSSVPVVSPVRREREKVEVLEVPA